MVTKHARVDKLQPSLGVGAGTTWEVEQIFERGYHHKAVFLLHDAHDEREVTYLIVP
jgi:hypothetical protein